MVEPRPSHVPEPAVGPGGGPVPEARRTRDRELAAEGWVRRFTGGPPQLGDVTALYEATGQEVLLDEVLPGDLVAGCEECRLAVALFRVVYTRPARGSDPSGGGTAAGAADTLTHSSFPSDSDSGREP
ncbi:MAG: hypothetical protein ACE5GJ_09050 [Gemmatimonadota bacterium]